MSSPLKKKVKKEEKDGKEEKKGTGRYHCDYCTTDISAEVRIKCATCKDFDLCVDCFSVGVEIGSHQNNHSYRVIDDMSKPLYTQCWSAEEEILLLEGIEMFGLGNWIDIAEHVGTKSKIQCDYHYWSTYIETPQDEIKSLVDDSDVNYDDLVKDEKGYYVSKKKRVPSKKKKLLIGLEPPVNFLPYRGDFVQEYEDHAEEILALMGLLKNDPSSSELKSKVLEGYSFKLSEREKRKEFAIERGFIDFKKVQTIEKKRTREEREIYNNIKPFARFMEHDDFMDFYSGLLNEQMIIEYRSLGIQTIQQSEKYETLKKNRETESIRERYRSRRNYSDSTALNEISSMIGFELLSHDEKELCVSLKIAPKQYMVAKDACIRQCELLEGLKRSTAIKMLGLKDHSKASKIYDYFIEAGWIYEE